MNYTQLILIMIITVIWYQGHVPLYQPTVFMDVGFVLHIYVRNNFSKALEIFQ
jgi:hypothetical protein